MFVRKELERRGSCGLVEIRLVGLNGQIESTAYEVTGPQPGQFSDSPTAWAWFYRAAAALELFGTEPA